MYKNYRSNSKYQRSKFKAKYKNKETKKVMNSKSEI